MFRARNDGERIADIQFADQIQMKFETRNLKFCRRRAKAQIKRLDRIIFAEAEFFYRAMRYVQQRREILFVAVAEQQTISRNQADEMREGFFDGFEIFKNVRVVEFEIVDDGDFRLVMDELAALVEKRRVVFITLDDEPFAVRESRALAEIVRNAADEKTRVQSAVF